MPSFETFVFAIFIFGCLACLAVKKAISKASENPAVKEIGLGLLSKWLGGK
jgi:hypothetical protein